MKMLYITLHMIFYMYFKVVKSVSSMNKSKKKKKKRIKYMKNKNIVIATTGHIQH